MHKKYLRLSRRYLPKNIVLEKEIKLRNQDETITYMEPGKLVIPKLPTPFTTDLEILHLLSSRVLEVRGTDKLLIQKTYVAYVEVAACNYLPGGDG